jgi:uncharacterized protein with GYD domain
MPATLYTRLIKFSEPLTTDDDFRNFKQQLTQQSEAVGDKVLEVVWTTGEFDVVSRIEASGAMPAPFVTESGYRKITFVELVHRPL